MTMKNLVAGSKIEVTEPIFEGHFNNAKCVGERIFIGEIISDKYGASGKHWFTILVTESKHETIKVGQKVRRQGKNIYNHSNILSQPDDIELKTADKEVRRHTEAYFNN